VLAEPQFAPIRVTFEKPLALGVSVLLAGFAATAGTRAQHAATQSVRVPTKNRRKARS
jgi:hypothetical protein